MTVGAGDGAGAGAVTVTVGAGVAVGVGEAQEMNVILSANNEVKTVTNLYILIPPNLCSI